MKNALVSLLLLTSGTADAASVDEPAFEFVKQVESVETKPAQQDELLSVPLDADVFAATRKNLADVRVVDEKGQHVVSLLRKVQTTRVRSKRMTWRAGNPAVRLLDNGGLELIIQLDKKDPRPHGLRLVSPLRNFEHRVRVFSSADGQVWEPASEETVIFDYSRFLDVRNDKIALKKSDGRHFRIVIDDVTAEQESELLALTRRLQGGDEAERVERITIDRRPFRIDRIDLWRDVKKVRTIGDKKAEYPAVESQVRQDPEKRQTMIEVDTRREPLTSLELETSTRNFSRHAVVEVMHQHGVKTSWREIGEGTLSHIDFRNLKRERLSISFPELREKRYRLVIDNHEAPPLDVTAIKSTGNAYELVFLAQPETDYQLVYGFADAEPSGNDTSVIQELLAKRFRPMRAKLGEQQVFLGGDQQPKSRWIERVNDPWLLVPLVVLMVIALGWGLFNAVRRVDSLSGGPSAEQASEPNDTQAGP